MNNQSQTLSRSCHSVEALVLLWTCLACFNCTVTVTVTVTVTEYEKADHTFKACFLMADIGAKLSDDYVRFLWMLAKIFRSSFSQNCDHHYTVTHVTVITGHK